MTAPAAGLLLAAGAGRRAGGPKALRADPGGTGWLVRSVQLLHDGGCATVSVVLGSGAAQARALLERHPWPADPPGVIETPDWAEGMGASLRAGLLVLVRTPVQVVLVHLVDLPDVTAAVVRRVLEHASGPEVLARATYTGRPGHPVLIGRDHLAAIVAELTGDQGARGYLDRTGACGVECGDLATGGDQDGPEEGVR